MKIKRFILFFAYVAFPFINAAQSWSYLSNGDLIAIVAPSCAPSEDEVKRAADLLGGIFEVVVPTDMVRGDQPFNRSNTIEYRRDHLLQELHSDAKLIWAIQGGHGASQLFLKSTSMFEEFRGIKPKLLIGHGDFTAIHLWANSIGWPSLYGVTLDSLSTEAYRLHSQILLGEVQELQYDLLPSNEFAYTATLDSSILGGDLSPIRLSLGQSRSPNTSGRILFIEDTGNFISKPCKDGCLGNYSELFDALEHIEEAGLLDSPKAIIWGNFKTEDNVEIAEIKRLFIENMNKRKIPVFSSDKFGHGMFMFPLPFNTLAKIEGCRLTVKTNQ